MKTKYSAILGGMFVVISAGQIADAAAAGLVIAPHSLSFGKVAAGSTSTAKNVTISNRSTSAVNIQSITASGNFAILNSTCGSTLAPNPGNCTVSVTYGPQGVNSTKGSKQSGALTIQDSASTAPQTVILKGVAVGSTTPALLVVNFNGNSVSLFPEGNKNGDVAPTATIAGPSTGLASPDGIALDSSFNIYVGNEFGGASGNGSVTIYSAGANGDASPSATIAGSNTMLHGTAGVAIDDSTGNIYVANADGNDILVFAPGSNGDVAPIATVAGNNTGLNEPVGIALDAQKRIFVVNCGSPCNGVEPSSVAVFPALGSSTGTINEAPSALLAGPNTRFDFPDGIAIGANGNVFIADAQTAPDIKHQGCLLEFSAAQVATGGNLAPTVVACASSVGKNCSAINAPLGVTLDSNGNLYVANSAGFGGPTPPSVTVYTPDLSDKSCTSATPKVDLSGSNTGFADPIAIVLVP